MEWLNLRGRLAEGWSRYFMVLLAGLLVSIFAGTLTLSTSVNAQTNPDATWSNGSLSKDGESYDSVLDQAVVSAMGVPAGSKVFTTKYDTSPSAGQQTVKAIVFGPSTTPEDETSADYSEYSFTPPGTWNRLNSSRITIDNSNAQPPTGSTNCALDGVGWMLCGPSMWIAKGMDTVYSWLDGFLQTRPLEVNNSSSMLFQAWDLIRGIANAVFIIVFLIIIYSQISSFGISNYGIKKMLPRLIIAALMVNLSYYICAIAIDLSNTIGVAIKDALDGVLSNFASNGQGNQQGMLSSESIIQAFLSGGAIAIGAGFATGASLTAGTPFIIPLLMVLLLSLIVAMLVLAVRQALIIILTIISPLAFVAYLLPGTEKWFEKWRNVFFTMMIFFPAFAAVFGGASLAGYIISHNASSIVMYVLGWAVQLAPLATTPLILKLGGGVLNRFAGIVNDPTRGVIDKSKEWARNKSKDIANRRTYGNDKLTNLNWARKAARGFNRRGRLLQDRIAESDMRAQTSYQNWEKARKQDINKRSAEMDKQQVDQELDMAWNKHLQKDTRAMEKDLKLRATVDKTELEKLKLDNRYAELKTGHLPTTRNADGTTSTLDGTEFRSLRDGASFTSQHLAAQGLRKNTADRELNKQIAEQMLVNTELLDSAAGIYGEIGRDNALASAVSTMRSEAGKSVESSAQLMKHFKLSAEQRQDLLKGIEIDASDGRATYTFKPTNSFAMEAAIEEQMAVGTVNQISEILSMSGSGGSLAEYRGSISEALAKSGVKGKAPFLGGKLINDVYKGEITGMEALQDYVVEWVAGGKFKPSDISIIDKEGLELLTASINKPDGRSTIGIDRLRGLREKIEAVYNSQDLMANVADNAAKPLDELYRSLP